jgi:hypothetical protein
MLMVLADMSKTNTIETGAPNLDAMTASELMTFWASYRGIRPVTPAQLMFPNNRVGRVKAFHDLQCYASNKATAIQCRQRGDIQTAQIYESICERIYSQLPDYAKW